MIGLGLGLTQSAMRGRRAGGSATQRLQQLLFGQGQQGVFYVPQPVVDGDQVLFTDAAGTAPVTADGDPVGLMLDLSGNGNHASQSVSAARVIYRTDGLLHWLEGDGVDDRLFTDPLSRIPDDLEGFSLSMAAQKVGSIGIRVSQNNSDESNRGFATNALISEDPEYYFGAQESDNYQKSRLVNFAMPETPHVFSGMWMGQNSRNRARINHGAWQEAVEALPTTGSFSPQSLEIFSMNDGNFFSGGKIFGLIVRQAYFSDTEHDLVDQYLAQKSGVSL